MVLLVVIIVRPKTEHEHIEPRIDRILMGSFDSINWITIDTIDTEISEYLLENNKLFEFYAFSIFTYTQSDTCSIMLNVRYE